MCFGSFFRTLAVNSVSDFFFFFAKWSLTCKWALYHSSVLLSDVSTCYLCLPCCLSFLQRGDGVEKRHSDSKSDHMTKQFPEATCLLSQGCTYWPAGKVTKPPPPPNVPLTYILTQVQNSITDPNASRLSSCTMHHIHCLFDFFVSLL